MEQYELLRRLVHCLEGVGIEYLVTGSMASMAYGEPRLTNDIDIVAGIRQDQIGHLKKCFPEDEFYLSEDSLKEAINLHRQFNIIHPASGLKIDVIIRKNDAFDNSRFKRIKRLHASGDTIASFASPEDVIIKKMVYYKEGGSEKHLRDITGILKISGETVDYDYVDGWVKKLNLTEIWEAILERINR